MEADILKQEKILQIKLVQYEQLTTKKLVRRIEIGLFVLLLIGAITYYYFNIDSTMILLNLSLLTLVFSFILFPLTDYSLTNNITLIIAFGEFQLMKNEKITQFENISYLDFKHRESASSKIPILTIKGPTFSEISIGYGNPKNSDIEQPIDYLIHSKLDWEILMDFTK